MTEISTRHPQYLDYSEDWTLVRDCYRGERHVKRKGVEYLPMTAGMIADGGERGIGTVGGKAYAAYRRRAVFPELVREAVETMLGVMHFKPPVIELPAAMEPLFERATRRNESLEALLRRINEEQLVTGRVGLLLDVPDNVPGPVLPHIALYCAEDIINWDQGSRGDARVEQLQLVVLDETADERTASGFDWQSVERYRVLMLGGLEDDGVEGVATYRMGEFEEGATYSEAAMFEPSTAGRTLNEIPFVFINTKDIVPEPDDAPLAGLGALSMTVYRSEADYRQALFMQGQDTLVIIGGRDQGGETRVGANATIEIHQGGDAKFIGVDSAGLPEMREALQNDYARGKDRAGALVEAVSRSAESGEALRVRVAARTASLTQIAQAGAFGLQEALRKLARWIGANPDEVSVTPNLDFVADTWGGQDLSALMGAKMLGAPISLLSIHELARARGLTERSWEEELEQMEREAEEGLRGAGSTDPEDERGASPAGAPVAEDESDGGDELPVDGDEDEEVEA